MIMFCISSNHSMRGNSSHVVVWSLATSHEQLCTSQTSRFFWQGPTSSWVCFCHGQLRSGRPSSQFFFCVVSLQRKCCLGGTPDAQDTKMEGVTLHGCEQCVDQKSSRSRSPLCVKLPRHGSAIILNDFYATGAAFTRPMALSRSFSSNRTKSETKAPLRWPTRSRRLLRCVSPQVPVACSSGHR